TAVLEYGDAAILRLDDGPRHVLDRHDHLEIEAWRFVRVDDLHGAVAAEEARDLLCGAGRCREADPLRVALREMRESLEREREMRTALCRCECVDLIDDHPAHRAQRLARTGTENEE